MLKLKNSLIGIGLKLKGGSMAYQAQLKKDARDYSEGSEIKFWIPARLSNNDIVIYWNSKLMSDGGDPMSLKEGAWIEFDGYSKNGKAYTAKQLKSVDALDVLDEDPMASDAPKKPTNNVGTAIDAAMRSMDMIRVRAVNDIMVESRKEQIVFSDQVAYVKRAINLYCASNMDDEEASAEYDDKGQKIPF
tara:strand:- start:1141 stop:1710 length:570 start_codon:yes stop_codon:yes gene_type:complete